jgi:hypothetical protein
MYGVSISIKDRVPLLARTTADPAFVSAHVVALLAVVAPFALVRAMVFVSIILWRSPSIAGAFPLAVGAVLVAILPSAFLATALGIAASFIRWVEADDADFIVHLSRISPESCPLRECVRTERARAAAHQQL